MVSLPEPFWHKDSWRMPSKRLSGQSILRNCHDRQVELFVALTTAQVQGALGKGSASLQTAKSLQEVLTQAPKAGLVNYELEARLSIGELELRSGNCVNGRTQLEALEKYEQVRVSDSLLKERSQP